MLSDLHTDGRLAILIKYRLWCKPALDSFSFMHADFSGTITGNFLLTIRTS